MDRPEYTSLSVALSAVPDPRHRRGRRHAWPVLLTLIGAALVSGQRGMRAISQWVREHQEELVVLLEPPRGRLPSDATLRRAVRAVDVQALEARVARFVAGLAPPSPPHRAARRVTWVGLAMDGKAVRGANRRGARVQLVSLVRHADGLVLAQRAVAAKSNEITVAPRLLAGRSLTGCVVTMDAQLTQRPLAAQVRQQGGH